MFRLGDMPSRTTSCRIGIVAMLRTFQALAPSQQEPSELLCTCQWALDQLACGMDLADSYRPFLAEKNMDTCLRKLA